MDKIVDLGEYREERRRRKEYVKVCCEMCDRALNKREERSGICDNCFDEIMGRR